MPSKNVSMIKSTLDKAHQRRVSQITERQRSLPGWRTQVAEERSRLADLLSIPTESRSAAHLREIVALRHSISVTEDEIRRAESGNESLEYIVAAMPVLSDYYNRPPEVTVRAACPSRETAPYNILSAIMAHNQQDSTASIMRDTGEISRSQLHERYLSDTEGRRTEQDDSSCREPDCYGTMALTEDETAYVCDVCGLSEHNLVLERSGSESTDRFKCTYQRATHLSEIISQIQAKVASDIPQIVFDDIYDYMVRRRISPKSLDYFKMRDILKSLGHRKYYEQAPHILQKVAGIAPPSFTPRQEAQLKHMFRQVEELFPEVKPKDRNNFLTYAYVIRKSLELLSLDRHLYYFRKLSHERKLREHDHTWRKMCRILNWEYIPSF